MAWEVDDDDGYLDPNSVGGSEWEHVEVAVRDPYARAFRLTHTRRYDLLNQMANALKLPRDADGRVVKVFLHHLYETTADSWFYDVWNADENHAHSYITSALAYLDEYEFFELVEAFGWSENLKAHVTPTTYEAEMRAAFTRRFRERTLRLLRRCQQANRRAAA